MKDKYLEIYQQEALQEALVELKEARQREKLLADENKAILSAISAMSEARNRHEIFSGLNSVLKKYIDFDDFIVITRDCNRQNFKTLLSTNSVLTEQIGYRVTRQKGLLMANVFCCSSLCD